MRINFYSCAFFTSLLFFAYFSATFIQDSVTRQEKGKVKLKFFAEDSVSVSETGTSEELMGMEVCHGKDEECLVRRMVAEAHLDYIYTQREKP
ncbi:hypothetical protein QQ045_003982 [Rhodiola kirilowii]